MIYRIVPLAALLVAWAGAAIAEGFNARVTDIVAGDIFQINRNGKSELVVLYGVVAGPSPLAAKMAKDFATQKALNQNVTVRVVDRKPKMTLVELTLPDKTNLGQAMLRNGLVRWDSLTAPQDQGLKDLENLAKRDRLGLWKSLTPEQAKAVPAESGAAARGKGPGGAAEQTYDRKIKAGYDILEGRTWKDEKGVRTIVLRGNGEKIPGFEYDAEQRALAQNEADAADQERMAAEEAAAEAEAARQANLEQMPQPQNSNTSPY